MNRWDHLDVVVTVGICATILGAGIFFFAFGGAPSGITERFVEPAPAVIDQEGVAQTALGGAIVEAQTLQYMEDVPFGLTQTRLGNEIVAATRTSEARAVLIPYLQEGAQESLGSAIVVVAAAQPAVSTGNVPSIPVALTPGVAGIQALREIPYPAGALLFAALFMIVWGVRCVAESGPPLPTYSTSDTAQELYRKAG